MEELTIKDLLESGVHFGHQARRWNPKMKKFIFTERNGIYIIDLQKTLLFLKKACDAVREIAAGGGTVLFVGTKPQSADIVREEAERSGQFYVTNRWLGGMLTNYKTIRQSVKRLEHFEKMSIDDTYEHITKKEIQNAEKQKNKLHELLNGIREMNKIPGLLIVVDPKRENIAVKEANRLGIPVCAIIDTNCDPSPIDYPIPGNDDAIRSIKTILTKITDSVIEGMQMRVDDEAVSLKESEEEIGEEKPNKSVKQKIDVAKTGDEEEYEVGDKEEKKEKIRFRKASAEEEIEKSIKKKLEKKETTVKSSDGKKAEILPETKKKKDAEPKDNSKKTGKEPEEKVTK